MQMQQPEGPVCQSCGMPMVEEEQFGTQADGARCEEYCVYCFQQGGFTAPDITLEDMIEHVAAVGVEKLGLTGEQARAMAANLLPHLARWQGG